MQEMEAKIAARLDHLAATHTSAMANLKLQFQQLSSSILKSLTRTYQQFKAQLQISYSQQKHRYEELLLTHTHHCYLSSFRMLKMIQSSCGEGHVHALFKLFKQVRKDFKEWWKMKWGKSQRIGSGVVCGSGKRDYHGEWVDLVVSEEEKIVVLVGLRQIRIFNKEEIVDLRFQTIVNKAFVKGTVLQVVCQDAITVYDLETGLKFITRFNIQVKEDEHFYQGLGFSIIQTGNQHTAQINSLYQQVRKLGTSQPWQQISRFQKYDSYSCINRNCLAIYNRHHNHFRPVVYKENRLQLVKLFDCGAWMLGVAAGLVVKLNARGEELKRLELRQLVRYEQIDQRLLFDRNGMVFLDSDSLAQITVKFKQKPSRIDQIGWLQGSQLLILQHQKAKIITLQDPNPNN